MNTKQYTSTVEFRSYLLMVASLFLFSTTSILLSYLSSTFAVSGWVASAYRAAIGLIAVYLMQKQTGTLSVIRIFKNPLLFTRGFIGGLTIPVYYISIMELGPGRAGMIGGIYPLFAVIFAFYFLKEKVPKNYIIYAPIAFFGLVALLYTDSFTMKRSVYDLVALCGAAAAGVCIVLIRHLRHTETTSTIFAAQCVFTLGLGLAGAGTSVWISNPKIFCLVVLAGITVVIAQLCLTEAFRHIDVAKGTSLQMLTPAVTVLGSVLFLGEPFTIVELAGGAAMLFASYKIIIASSRSNKNPPVDGKSRIDSADNKQTSASIYTSSASSEALAPALHKPS